MVEPMNITPPPSYFTCLIFLSLFICSPFAYAETFRILHVMSYHADWKWNKDQLNGFKSALTDKNTDYRIIELDTKRNNDEEQIQKKVIEAKKLVSEWKPHLIYVNDDNVQRYFTMDYVNSKIPIVFSGLNRDPSEYNFIGSKNVTGVLEQEHFKATINLLNSISPNLKKIAVVVDSDPTWKGVMSRIRNHLRDLPNIEVVDWALISSFSEYKEKIKSYQNEIDAIALLGVFNLVNEDQQNEGYESVLKWTTENSSVPDFSFWHTRVERGTLCAVTVSGYEQGFLAGNMARQILVNKKSPQHIKMATSKVGVPVVNIARARKLGIKVDTDILLSSTIITGFTWDK